MRDLCFLGPYHERTTSQRTAPPKQIHILENNRGMLTLPPALHSCRFAAAVCSGSLQKCQPPWPTRKRHFAAADGSLKCLSMKSRHSLKRCSTNRVPPVLLISRQGVKDSGNGFPKQDTFRTGAFRKFKRSITEERNVLRCGGMSF